MPIYVNATLDNPSTLVHTAHNDINNLGQTVGYFEDASGVHGFFYSAGVWTTLNDPLTTNHFTYAAGINDYGQIVGNYNTGGQVSC